MPMHYPLEFEHDVVAVARTSGWPRMRSLGTSGSPLRPALVEAGRHQRHTPWPEVGWVRSFGLRTVLRAALRPGWPFVATGVAAIL